MSDGDDTQPRRGDNRSTLPTPRQDSNRGSLPSEARKGDSRVADPRQDSQRSTRLRNAAVTRREPNHRPFPLALVVGLVVALVAIIVVVGSAQSCQASQQQVQEAQPQQPTVSFCAVGDNIMNTNLLDLGKSGDGTESSDYDFKQLYENIKPTIESYDIAFVNQETVLGNRESFDYAGYPSFNTPDSMADALSDTGFDVVNINSNHTYDIGTDAIVHQQEVFKSYTNLITVGSHASESDRERPRIIERNGIKIAFLSYSYGQNGYLQSQLPNDYYAVPYDESAMEEDVLRAKGAADVVIVYMHGGTEYDNEPDEWEKMVSQKVADLGVDLVIGSHAHVNQPMEWLSSTDGGSQTLVVYGLGDFLSGYHNNPDCIMSGMMSCDFVRQDDGSVTIENVVWHPLIEHWRDDKDTVILVRDYSPELAEQNELLDGQNNPYGWIVSKTREVIGDQFTIDV